MKFYEFYFLQKYKVIFIYASFIFLYQRMQKDNHSHTASVFFQPPTSTLLSYIHIITSKDNTALPFDHFQKQILPVKEHMLTGGVQKVVLWTFTGNGGN